MKKTYLGLERLTTFHPPPEGICLTIREVLFANPSDEVLEIASTFSCNELTELAIDVCGSFEITHENYQKPTHLYKKAGKPFVLFLRKALGVDEGVSKSLKDLRMLKRNNK
jgi:hypothetical protein